MKIYQGEPLGGKINIKDGDAYLPSLEGVSLDAALVSSRGIIVRRWSTEDGTITVGQETIDGQTVGYAAFSASGNVTKKMDGGAYTIEVAKVLEDGKAIGVAREAVLVLRSAIGRL